MEVPTKVVQKKWIGPIGLFLLAATSLLLTVSQFGLFLLTVEIRFGLFVNYCGNRLGLFTYHAPVRK